MNKPDKTQEELAKAVDEATTDYTTALAAVEKAGADAATSYKTLQLAYKALVRANHARKATPMPTHPLNVPA